MRIITSKQDFEDFYRYGSKPPKYPKEYPCVCWIESDGGGLSGEIDRYYAIYPSQLKGKSLCEIIVSIKKDAAQVIC